MLIIDTGGDQQPGGYPLLNRNAEDLSWQAYRFHLPYDPTITGIQNLIGGFRSGGYTIRLATSDNLNGSNLFSATVNAALNADASTTNPDRGQWFGRRVLLQSPSTSCGQRAQRAIGRSL
jgi:hypothetical protein